MNVYEIVTEQFINALSEEKIPWRKDWTGENSGRMFWHKNPASGTIYSGINSLLLTIAKEKAGFSSPYWMTGKQINQKGGRYSGPGALVVYFKMLERETDRINAKGEKVIEEIPLLRYYRVWNQDQITGVEFPEKPGADKIVVLDHENNLHAEKLISGYFDRPEIKHSRGDRAYYSPAGDYIHLPEKGLFKSGPAYYSTAFHELVHSTGHHKRLGRFKENDRVSFGSADYSKEELVAEIGSGFLCHMAGIGADVIQNQKAYIQGWIKALQNNPKWVVFAGGQAEKAVKYIRGEMKTA